jgi:hypothetical protein
MSLLLPLSSRTTCSHSELPIRAHGRGHGITMEVFFGHGRGDGTFSEHTNESTRISCHAEESHFWREVPMPRGGQSIQPLRTDVRQTDVTLSKDSNLATIPEGHDVCLRRYRRRRPSLGRRRRPKRGRGMWR